MEAVTSRCFWCSIYYGAGSGDCAVRCISLDREDQFLCGRRQQDNYLSGSRIPSLHWWRDPAGHSSPRSIVVRQRHLHSPAPPPPPPSPPPPIHRSTAHQVEARPRNRDPTSILFNTPQQQQRLPDHEACLEEHGDLEEGVVKGGLSFVVGTSSRRNSWNPRWGAARGSCAGCLAGKAVLWDAQWARFLAPPPIRNSS